MKHTMRTLVRLGTVGYSTDPLPPQVDEATRLALEKAQYEADVARAEHAKLKAQLDEIKKQLPSEEQRARYLELEAQALKAEEERARKEGDFHAWRTQITEKHEKDLQEFRERIANEEAGRKRVDKQLDDTLISTEFANALELFGPTGKTIFTPEMAQPYFSQFVEVQKDDAGLVRRVVVKDLHGAVIVDEKKGTPKAFAAAMQQLIDSHPRKEHMLRGSGKSGSGSLGGHNGASGELDTSRLKPADFHNPDVQAALRKQANAAGGMQIAPGYDRFMQHKK
jgi:hypothetical protein